AGQPQHVLLFLALVVGDDDDRAETERAADERQPDAGIARCSFHDHAAGAQRPALDRIANDEEGGAVLYRLGGVHEFGLAVNLAAGELGGTTKADERCVADRLNKRWLDVHGGWNFSHAGFSAYALARRASRLAGRAPTSRAEECFQLAPGAGILFAG